ncbi:MAG: DNA mismatch repair protein MutS, partial [Lentisphaeria bacterium]
MSDNNSPKVTPMMRQYLQVKQEIPNDCILLFRMGDFYELFFDDAERGSEIMEINLTRRAGVPMCGIPYHSLRNYLPKIIESGVKFAIAEQMEDPKDAKGIVRREVTQIITPGTILDSEFLAAGKNNYIVALFNKGPFFGIAALDISTGDFRITQCNTISEVETELSSLNPPEIIISYNQESLFDSIKSSLSHTITWTKVEAWTFDYDTATQLLCQQFKVISLDGFGCRELPIAVCAAGAVLYYAKNNLKCRADHLCYLSSYNTNSFLTLDRISQRNLELVSPIFTESKNSTLLSVLDKCVTPMGKRMLRDWILRPLQDKFLINQRLDAVDTLHNDQILLSEVREILNQVKDL